MAKKKRSFSDNALKKIGIFITRFTKDPTQHVENLCNEIHIGKSVVYDYLREKKMTMSDLRNGNVLSLPDKSSGSSFDGEKPAAALPSVVDTLSTDEIRTLIEQVDEIRARKKVSLETAIKKAPKSLITNVSKYYYYKNKLGVPKRAYKKKDIQVQKKAPMVPHVIEYVEKPAKKSPELLMMLGTPEALLDFVKKMQGVQE